MIVTQNKICLINSTKSWGGGEKWHYDIAIRLKQKGFEIIVVTNKNSELYKRLETSDIKIYSVAISNLSFLNVFKQMAISKILEKENINTVILNLPSDLKVAGIAAKRSGVKNIIYRRGSAIPIKNTPLNRYLFGNIITTIIANSEETKRTILKNAPDLFPADKIHVIYNGIDLPDYDNKKVGKVKPINDNEIILGNAGRLDVQKAQKYLIDIAKKLKAKGRKFKILIAGEGKLLDELIEYSKEQGVNDVVIFNGFVENIKSFMENIDIFLLTSQWEGFGYVIVEAMASKKAVIAFDLSSNPEIISQEKTGFLVENKNIDAFVEKIELLTDNEKLRNKFGVSGRKKVEELFEINITMKKIIELINKQP